MRVRQLEMYNLRDDLFKRDGEDSHLSSDEHLLNPGSALPSSRSESFSYSSVRSPIVNDNCEDEIYFPSYDNEKSHGKESCPHRLESAESLPEASPIVQRSVSPCADERSEDDTAASVRPSRHVDYLNHEWTEEDIWSSWKYLSSKKNVYPNNERLLNASWRAWEKKRRNLKTVSPGTVRWYET